MVIDLPADKGLAHFHRITSVLNLPEFVKQADFEEQIATNDLPAGAFADPIDKKFPIHTKTAAYLSYAYFLDQCAQGKLDKKATQRCAAGFEKAAEYWNLLGEFLETKEIMTAKPEKQAAAVTPTEILKAASELVQTKGNYTFEQRNAGAKGILKAAAEVGLPISVIPEEVHRMAGLGVTTKEAAVIELTRRWDSETRPSLAEPLHACMTALNGLKSGLLGGEVCEKVASIIDRYDRSKGIASFPEDILFAFTKSAADKLAGSLVTMIDGTSYRITDLTKAADAFGVLGKDISNAIKSIDGSLDQVKVAELIDTLPRMDADILKDALAVMGVRPVTLDKQAMVAEVVEKAQAPGFTVMPRQAEKRADVLAKLEAADPLVKRALNTIRQLKQAKSSCDGGEGCDGDKKKSDQPRDYKRLFINKAPNSHSAKPVKG
jgi:hypothetical protein